MAKKSYPSREERMKDLNQRLEQGIRDVFESERFRDYLSVMSRFHTYSARNVLLIHMQRPNATRVASAKRWKEQFERFINKGEKAIYIMAPIPIVQTVERQKLDPDTKAPVLDEDGQVITEKREVQVPRFRPVPVFDVSQTNGKPLPQLAQDLTGDVEQYEAFMEALRRTAPVPMEIKPMAENLDGYFSLDEQRISIRAGMSEVQTVCAAVHEITHSILHNQKGVREDKAVRTAQELEAESVSYVVCQYCGVETGANSFGYLASWSKDKELSELRSCLATINKTANQLIGEIDRHFAEVCKERGIMRETQEYSEVPAEISQEDKQIFTRNFAAWTVAAHQGGAKIVSIPEDQAQAAAWAAEKLRSRDLDGLENILLSEAVTDSEGFPLYDGQRELLDQLDRFKRNEYILDKSGKENLPKFSANFEGPDTPEQFAAALYDYMAELEAAGMLQHPYSLDPREQTVSEIAEELRAGHFADIRNTLDRVGEQTGLPTAVAMLDRLEKLSDLRDQGLTFRLETNPNATSYQDQGYLQAAEWNREDYIPREVVYVGPIDRCRELLYQLEVGEITARQVRGLDQTEPKELEALYLLDDTAYLHIQLRDEGYDYTLYDKETMRLRDGGVIDAEDVALSPIKHPLAAVREGVLDAMGERPEKVEAVPLELVEKLQEAQLELPAASSHEKLIEHFAAEDAALFDTELDAYPMPDPSLSMEDLSEAGYTENDLLPVSLDTAELMYGGDFTVYLIRPGENPEMVFDEEDFDHHDGLFAVPREEWEASPDFDDAIQDRLREEEQQKRETAFLDHQGDCFALYQLHRGPELRDLRYISLERLRAEGASPRKGNYDLVYTAPLTGQGDALQQLDQLWHQFNMEHPADYHSPSMSISDIVALKQGGVLSCHYVDQYAFSELPGFFSGRNPLRAAEDSLEQNDNQLDGILNNTPSVAELEAQVKAGQQISLVDLAQAVRKEQAEKKKSVVAQLRNAPPAQEHRKKTAEKSTERER